MKEGRKEEGEEGGSFLSRLSFIEEQDYYFGNMEEEPTSLIRRTRFPKTVYHHFDASKLSHLPFTIRTNQISGKSRPESTAEPNCVEIEKAVSPTQNKADSDASNESSTQHKFSYQDSHGTKSQTLNQIRSRSLNVITDSIKNSIAMSLKFRDKWKCHKESQRAKSFNNRGKKVASEEMADENMFDLSKLFLGQRFAHGAHSQLYHGIYANEPVAVKVVRLPDDDENGSLSTRLENQFTKETIFLSRLRHENVIKLVGACRKPSIFCVVTEYLREGSLRLYLQKLGNESLPMQKVISMALDIARGMEYIHSKGIVHRDLKPDNILVSGDLQLKVCDFGISCEEAHCNHKSGDPGTYRWMAPEMIKRKQYGRKVDVYAFGLVLWELLARKVPFKDMTPIQAAFAVAIKNMRPNVPADCPLAMKALIEHCWCAKPDKRPEFSRIVKVLEGFATSLPMMEHWILA